MSDELNTKGKKVLATLDEPMNLDAPWLEGATYQEKNSGFSSADLRDVPQEKPATERQPHSIAMAETQARRASAGVDHSTDAGLGASGATIRGQRERKGF